MARPKWCTASARGYSHGCRGSIQAAVRSRPLCKDCGEASLLLWEGRSLAYVAEQAGHSIATLARHYAGVIRELGDAPPKPAAEAIIEARKRT
jgi:hypothetical protein